MAGYFAARYLNPYFRIGSISTKLACPHHVWSTPDSDYSADIPFGSFVPQHKHLGARIGILSVLHTWGSALTHHPHVHMIVPGGGISLDGTRWVACRPNFLLAVEVLSCLFRRLVLEKLAAAHCAGELQFFGKHMALTNPKAFAAYLAPLHNKDWVVYAKRPFGGPRLRAELAADTD